MIINQFWFRVVLAVLIFIVGVTIGFAVDHNGAFEWFTGALTVAFLIRVLIPPEF